MFCVLRGFFVFTRFKVIIVEVFVKFESFVWKPFLVDLYLQSCIDWSFIFDFSKLDVGWVAFDSMV